MINSILLPSYCKLCKHDRMVLSRAVDPDSLGMELQSGVEGIQPLVKHLSERHPNVFAAANALGQEFMGSIIVNQFDVGAHLAEQADRLRWHLHQKTGVINVPDARVIEKTKELLTAFMDPPQIEAAMQDGYLGHSIVKMVIAMRDQILERGRYQIKNDPAAAIAGVEPGERC